MSETQPSGVQSITIQGIKFEAPAPYAAGHVLTEAEANTLNQVLGENLRNNFANQVREAKEAAGENGLSDEALNELHTKFADYAAKYEFSGKRTARAPVDPVAREASKIAGGIVREALKSKGYDLKKMPEGQFDDLVAKFLATPKGEEIKAEAARRVEAVKSAASQALDGLLENAA